jgi:hypothetical protein
VGPDQPRRPRLVLAPRRRALEAFGELIVRLQEAADELPLPALLDELLDETKLPGAVRPRRPGRPGAAREHRELLSAAQEMNEAASNTAAPSTGGAPARSPTTR